MQQKPNIELILLNYRRDTGKQPEPATYALLDRDATEPLFTITSIDFNGCYKMILDGVSYSIPTNAKIDLGNNFKDASIRVTNHAKFLAEEISRERQAFLKDITTRDVLRVKNRNNFNKSMRKLKDYLINSKTL